LREPRFDRASRDRATVRPRRRNIDPISEIADVESAVHGREPPGVDRDICRVNDPFVGEFSICSAVGVGA
jgi:hypothetical protein